MARAPGNDLSEIFGYAPDDATEAARRQWKSQQCPFLGGICIKHGRPPGSSGDVVFGTCSVANKTRRGLEEVIICPHRLYAERYQSLRACVLDATGLTLPILTGAQYSDAKRMGTLPDDAVVLLGQRSGREICVSTPNVISFSFDWVMARITRGSLAMTIPCEVQSIDTTNNYHDAWLAYSVESHVIPNSRHGMNWANVWKRLIPQLILKGVVAAGSKLCTHGMYFVVPDRVFQQFEKLIGPVPAPDSRCPSDSLTAMTYRLGPPVYPGNQRRLELARTVRMRATGFAAAFGAGSQLPKGAQLDLRVSQVLDAL